MLPQGCKVRRPCALSVGVPEHSFSRGTFNPIHLRALLSELSVARARVPGFVVVAGALLFGSVLSLSRLTGTVVIASALGFHFVTPVPISPTSCLAIRTAAFGPKGT